MSTRFNSLVVIAAITLAAFAALSPLTRAADETTAPPVPVDREIAEQAKLEAMLNGPMTVYLEGNTTTPFLVDATFKMRYRFGERDFLIFDDKGTRVIIRAEQIIALRVGAAAK